MEVKKYPQPELKNKKIDFSEGMVDGEMTYYGFTDFAGSGIVHMAGAAAALAGVLLLAGIVATSRLYISDHTQKEVYMGLLVGALCQAAAYFFVM